MTTMLPPASPFQLEEFERLQRKIWKSLIEADVRVRILENPGLWQRVLAAVRAYADKPVAPPAVLQARWRSLLERYELLWDQLSVQDPGEVDRHWRALQVEHRKLIEEAKEDRLDTRLAVKCEAEALRARGGLEAEKAHILAEIEKLREESKKPLDSARDWRVTESLRLGLDDLEAKYRIFGGTLPDPEG